VLVTPLGWFKRFENVCCLCNTGNRACLESYEIWIPLEKLVWKSMSLNQISTKWTSIETSIELCIKVDTRVRTFFIVLQSNIFGSTTIKLKWQTVKHLFKFYMELDGISSTSFQVFDYADLKGKRQRNLKPFYFAWLNLRLPPRLHVTRARPYQGGSWECWGPPWISTFETWNIYWEYIKYSYINLIYQKFSWRLLSIIYLIDF